MKKATMYIASGLLLTAAAVKLFFPARSTEMIGTVNTSLSGPEKTAQDVVQIPGEPAMPVTVTINAADFLGAAAAEEEQAVSPVDLPASVEAAVETFLESQTEFEGLAIPTDVTYDVKMPSFPYVKPVAAATSSAFGYRVHPLENLTKFHYGTDLAAMSGDDIVSFAKGIVTEVGEDSSYGKYIRISHDDGYATMYAHCGSIYVAAGQAVSMGQKIALVGATGKVTGPHLHFELTKDGVYMNPEFYLAAL